MVYFFSSLIIPVLAIFIESKISFSTTQAHAYIDPGIGLLIQGFLAALATSVAVGYGHISKALQKIKSKFKKNKSTKTNNEEDTKDKS